MIFYLVPEVSGQPSQLAPTQADAREMCKARGLKPSAFEQHNVPTDKEGLLTYVNLLLANQPNWADDESEQADDEAEERLVDDLQNGRVKQAADYVKPAFTQAQVDAMFTSIDEKALPDVDTVCHAIATFEGAAIGHVAHELAARIQRLGSAVANG